MDRLRTVIGIDLRTLALFRVALATMVIADLISRARDLTAHYTDYGVLPRAELLTLAVGWRPSLHLMSGSTAMQALLFLVAGVIAVAMLVGYRTRLATILSWLMLMSLQHRNLATIQGGDNLLLLLLFWSMFLPLGARFSLDAAVDRELDKAPDAYASAATVALLVQVMSVYFFSAFLKSAPQWWPQGTAVYHALNLDHLATPFAVWFRQFDPLLTALTYYVWLLELIGPILIFLPIAFPWLRLVLQWMFITMHLGFFLCLEIGLFPFISIASLTAFTPGWVWDWLGGRLRAGKRRGLQMFYDGDCEFCRKTCLVLRTMLLLDGTPIRRAQEVDEIHDVLKANNSWVVVDHDDSRHVRWEAVALVFRRSPLFAWLGALLGTAALAGPGERIYEAVARNRNRLSRFTAVWLPYRSQQLRSSWLTNAVVAGLMLVVLWINLATLPGLGITLPRVIVDLRRTLDLAQKWEMFAPAPSTNEGWFVIRGETEDGKLVDVLRRRPGRPSYERPQLLAREYSTYRWRKYLLRLVFELEPAYQPLYAQYLCRSWDKTAGPGERLKLVGVDFMHERIGPKGTPRTTRRVLFIEHVCF